MAGNWKPFTTASLRQFQMFKPQFRVDLAAITGIVFENYWGIS